MLHPNATKMNLNTTHATAIHWEGVKVPFRMRFHVGWVKRGIFERFERKSNASQTNDISQIKIATWFYPHRIACGDIDNFFANKHSSTNIVQRAGRSSIR